MFATNDRQWLDPLDQFKVTAFRLEQQPVYVHDLTNPDFVRWMAGDDTPREPSDYSRSVETAVADGKTIHRVRVFEDPPTRYQEWLRWYSAVNVKAGETQQEIGRSVADQHGLTAAGDWWLLDDELLIVFHFDGYTRTGVELVDDPLRVAAAAHSWSTAVDLADQVAVTA